MMEPAAPSAIQRASLRDKASFVASPRRAIRVRAASLEEKAEAGILGSVEAKAILLRLCREVIKVIVADHPLVRSVAEPATTFARICGRPAPEVFAAFTTFPIMRSDDLADLAHHVMGVRSGCRECSCAGGYAPVLATLALAAGQARSKPWTVSGLNGHFQSIRAASPGPVDTSNPQIKLVSAAINQVVEAAGYTPYER
jgi:hypothetical protein